MTFLCLDLNNIVSSITNGGLLAAFSLLVTWLLVIWLLLNPKYTLYCSNYFYCFCLLSYIFVTFSSKLFIILLRIFYKNITKKRYHLSLDLLVLLEDHVLVICDALLDFLLCSERAFLALQLLVLLYADHLLWLERLLVLILVTD